MKKFDNYASHLQVLRQAYGEDLSNECFEKSVWCFAFKSLDDNFIGKEG